MQSTPVRTPPMEVSDEATREQLQMAREQGEVMGKALEHMTNQVAHGQEVPTGEYLVGYAVEKAEGMYELRDGDLIWLEPQDANAHIEVSVRDGSDGRFIPGLTVYATLFDSEGNEVGTHQQPFIWHPWLYHYGRNWVVPGSGEYTLLVRIEPPTFMRHDRKNGQRFTQPVDVEFRGVMIETGSK